MTQQITNLTGTTELEAVNAMLSAIGQAPITDVTASLALTDVSVAVSKLREATREVQTLTWKFNTRFQVPISPVGTQAWTDPDGTVQTLNIFLPPSNLGAFTPSRTCLMSKQGFDLDLTIGPSVVYTPGTLVFIDRRFNRDGLIASNFPKLYIDAQYLFNFEQLPETARRYITVLAGRRFITSVLGAQELEGFALKNEAQTLRELKRDQGDEDEYNMLDHPDVSRVLGFRSRITGSFVDYRRGR